MPLHTIWMAFVQVLLLERFGAGAAGDDAPRRLPDWRLLPRHEAVGVVSGAMVRGLGFLVAPIAAWASLLAFGRPRHDS